MITRHLASAQPAAATDAGLPDCRVRVSIDLAGIRAAFERERPAVRDGDWDGAGYLAERVTACGDALRALADAHQGLRLEFDFDTDATCGDRVQVSPVHPGADAPPAALVQAIEHALRPVFADAGAWRRHLGAAWFERHRAWLREAGSPIAH